MAFVFVWIYPLCLFSGFLSRHFCFVSNATFNKVSVNLLPSILVFCVRILCAAHRFINYSLMILHFSFMLLCGWFINFLILLLPFCLWGAKCRNYLLKKRLSKGPNKIVLSAADFVFPIDMRRVSSFLINVFCVILFRRKVKAIIFFVQSENDDILNRALHLCHVHNFVFGICTEKKLFATLWKSDSL